MKKISNIFTNLDKWVSTKGDGNYLEYEYNPYVCMAENSLNEEKGIQQVRKELYILVEKILETKNDNGSCLEIGLGHFGSTHFLWRQLFDEVITIEKEWERVREFGRNTKSYHNNKFVLDDGNSKFYHGLSNDEKIVEKVYDKHENISMLFIDGNHTYASVLADFLLYYPLVKKGGIVAFHDTIYSSGYNEDVPKLIRDLKNGKFTNGKRIPIKDIVESETQGISYFIKDGL